MAELEVQTLLSRFPGPLTLPGERVAEKPGSGGFVIFPIVAMLFLGIIISGHNLILGWVGLVMFVLVTVVGAIQLLPASAGLILDDEGFRRYVLFYPLLSKWRDISDFTIAPIVSPFSGRKITTMIWFHDQGADRSWFGRLIMKLSPYNAGINPVDGLSIEQLADLMARWQQLALAGAQRAERSETT